MYLKLLGVLGLTGALVAPAGASDDQSPGLAAVQPSCELHIWPTTNNFAVIYYNPIYSGHDSAFVGRKKRPIPQALSPADQLTLLQQLDLPRLLDLPAATTVIPHDVQLEREQAMMPKRHSKSASSCQGELIIQAVAYQSAAQVDRSLRVTMTYQVFAQYQEAPIRRFTTSTKAHLKRFPATKAEDVPEANAELEDAFKKTVITFTGYAARVPGSTQ